MKKLLTSLFVLGTLAFGAEDTMNINATVVEKLTVRVDEDAEFGRIAKGESATAVGKYSVKGEAGQKVRIEFGTTSGIIPLKHVSGATMEASVSHLDEIVTLAQDAFVQATPITFTVNVPEYAVTGAYTGEMLLSARYE